MNCFLSEAQNFSYVVFLSMHMSKGQNGAISAVIFIYANFVTAHKHFSFV